MSEKLKELIKAYCEGTVFGPPPGMTVDDMDDETIIYNMRAMAFAAGYQQGRVDEREALMEDLPTYYASFRPGAGWSMDHDERGVYIPLRRVPEACLDENGYQQAIAVKLMEVSGGE